MKKMKIPQMYLLVISILSLFLMFGCDGGGSSGSWDEPTTPGVTSTVPANNATGVPVGNSLTVTFTEPMDPLTITTTTFTLQQGTATVLGDVTYFGLTAVFNPTDNLEDDTPYTAKITTGATDLAGNRLAVDKVWSFTTGSTADTSNPTVTLTVPAAGATAVAPNSKVTATFSEAMDPVTINDPALTFTLQDTGVTPGSVDGSVTYIDKHAVFTPDADLEISTEYTATITIGATDLAGNPLAADKVWTFTTGTIDDTTAPTVTLTNPVDTATDVILSKKIQATFDESMNQLTITTTTFTLEDDLAAPVSGTVTYAGLVATFTPDVDLTEDTTYTATITPGAEDLADNPLAIAYEWDFTTIAVIPSGPSPVDLGTAEDFVLLAKSGITTTGVTAITGDIGVSPIDSTAITGFGLIMDSSNEFATSSLVTGNVYAADYTVPTPANMTTAISDMETAFTAAAGRSIPDYTELGAGDISGMTLVPGLYKWGTGVLIDNRGVTLSGGADDVWIFQIEDNLTVNSGAIVTLAGGAQAKNIFWQVNGGTGVTFGPGSAFQGIVLASKAIVFKDGATLEGRALAQTEVTLIANTITEP
jgi:hypothetical protein